jgi:hypothetical protein
MVRSDSWVIKAYWLLLFMGGVGGGLYFCYISSKSYFEYEVTVSIKAVEESPTYFPGKFMLIKRRFSQIK